MYAIAFAAVAVTAAAAAAYAYATTGIILATLGAEASAPLSLPLSLYREYGSAAGWPSAHCRAEAPARQ